MYKESYFLLLHLLRHRLRDLDIITCFFQYFISKTYFVYLQISNVIASLQQKYSFIIVFAITLLSTLLS